MLCEDGTEYGDVLIGPGDMVYSMGWNCAIWLYWFGAGKSTDLAGEAPAGIGDDMVFLAVAGGENWP